MERLRSPLRAGLSIAMSMAMLATVMLFFAEVWAATGREKRNAPTSMERILTTMRNVLPRSHSREHIAVIIENHTDARPFHAGVAEADMVIEMIVEGGISRFIAILDRADVPQEVGPVRSLRPYLFSAAAPYAASIIHAGGSPEALALADAHPETRTINILGNVGAKAGNRRSDIPAPHNLFVTAAGLQTIAHPIGKTLTWPPFRTGGRPAKDAPTAQKIDVNFGSRAHNVTFTYNNQKKRYARVNGGIASMASPANILIIESPITAVGEHGRLTIPLQSGIGYLFRAGRMEPISWRKSTNTQPFTIATLEGGTQRVASGKIWMMVLPALDRVSWKES